MTQVVEEVHSSIILLFRDGMNFRSGAAESPGERPHPLANPENCLCESPDHSHRAVPQDYGPRIWPCSRDVLDDAGGSSPSGGLITNVTPRFPSIFNVPQSTARDEMVKVR